MKTKTGANLRKVCDNIQILVCFFSELEQIFGQFGS